ncbi:MAG: response regulator, partial [Candidatus Levyibacteriota bacterium]
MDKKPIKLLLIEDDKDDYILLRSQLSKIPTTRYKLDWEATFEAGLRKLLQSKHDLYLVDYQLGERNGIELIKEARANGHTLPIILLTGLSNSEIDIQALQAGADDYLTKGQIVGDLLDRTIRYAIERKKFEKEREKFMREQIASKLLDKRKDEFMGIVSHELKTPVTSLKVFAQVLQKRFITAGDDNAAQL